MAQQIRVDTDALRQAAKQYKKAAYLIDGENNCVVGRLHIVINTIDEKWEGKACDEFVVRLKNELTKVLKLAETMRDMQTCCDQIVEVYKRADTAVLPSVTRPLKEEIAYAKAHEITRKTGKR